MSDTFLARSLSQRTDGRFVVEVGDVAVRDGASSDLNGMVSLKIHILLETTP